MAEDGPTSVETGESDVAAAVAAAAVDVGPACDPTEGSAAVAILAAGFDDGADEPLPLALPTCGSVVGGPAVSGNTVTVTSAGEIGGVFHDQVGATRRSAGTSWRMSDEWSPLTSWPPK